MASRSLGTLTLDLIAKTGGYVNGLSKAERETEKWRRKVERDVKAAGKVIGTTLAVGAAAAAAGLAHMVRSSLDAIDAQAKMAQRLRTSYDSLSNLARAGELAGVSMQQIEVASRSLDINLGRASQGFKAQADALAKLKLSADDIAKLPLDKRIQAINIALKENVSETERAAVAADLFGSRGAAAIQQLSPDTIAEAARQVEIFGLNLSDVDAAKIELANDAMSTFGLLSEGVANQLTVELAPILEAIGNEFLSSAEAAGGLGVVIKEFAREAVNDIAAVINVLDGFAVAFKTAVDSVAVFVGKTLSFVTTGNLSQLFSDIADNAVADVEKMLATPLLGEKLKQFYSNAQKAGETAAAAAVGAREETGKYNQVLTETSEELKKISVNAKQIELSKDIQETIKAQEAYAALVAELRTDEEKLNDTLQERVAILKAVGQVNSETASRAAAAAFQSAPQYGGLAPEIGGAFGELRNIDKAQAELEDWYSTQLDLLTKYRAEQSELNEQWNAQELALKREHEAAIADIEYARQQASLVATEDLFGNLSDAARVYAGEQSGIYKALFAVEKAAAIARSLVAIQSGIAQAAANPFPANLAAMASVAAATANIIGSITSVSLAGQAHDGIDSVPKSGTWNLEKGERVTTAKTSAKLDRTLDSVMATKRESMAGGTNLRIVNAFDTGEVVGGYLGSKSGEKAVMNIVNRNRRTIQSLIA